MTVEDKQGRYEDPEQQPQIRTSRTRTSGLIEPPALECADVQSEGKSDDELELEDDMSSQPSRCGSALSLGSPAGDGPSRKTHSATVGDLPIIVPAGCSQTRPEGVKSNRPSSSSQTRKVSLPSSAVIMGPDFCEQSRRAPRRPTSKGSSHYRVDGTSDGSAEHHRHVHGKGTVTHSNGFQLPAVCHTVTPCLAEDSTKPLRLTSPSSQSGRGFSPCPKRRFSKPRE